MLGINKFLVDENISPQISDYLKKLGYNSRHIRDVGLTGSSDEKVADYSAKNCLIIITGDQGFGQSFYLKKVPSLGMVVLKTKSYRVDDVKRLINFADRAKLLENDLSGVLMVISQNFVRRLVLR